MYANEKEILIVHENTKEIEKCFVINVSINTKSEIEIVYDNEINLKMTKKGMNLRLLDDVSKVANSLGRAPFGLKFFSPNQITFNKY